METDRQLQDDRWNSLSEDERDMNSEVYHAACMGVEYGRIPLLVNTAHGAFKGKDQETKEQLEREYGRHNLSAIDDYDGRTDPRTLVRLLSEIVRYGWKYTPSPVVFSIGDRDGIAYRIDRRHDCTDDFAPQIAMYRTNGKGYESYVGSMKTKDIDADKVDEVLDSLILDRYWRHDTVIVDHGRSFVNGPAAQGNYKVHRFREEGYRETVEFETETMYPSHSQLFGGVPIGARYQYVSSTYLNGLVNYVDEIKVAFVSLEYCTEYTDSKGWHGHEEKYEEIIRRLDIMTDPRYNHWQNTNLGDIGGCVLLIGELEDSWVVFEYDADVSDCSVWRVSKEKYTYDEVLEHVLYNLKYRHDYEGCVIGEYIELPTPRGWVNF